MCDVLLPPGVNQTAVKYIRVYQYQKGPSWPVRRVKPTYVDTYIILYLYYKSKYFRRLESISTPL
jgi:hypothetical protein